MILVSRLLRRLTKERIKVKLISMELTRVQVVTTYDLTNECLVEVIVEMSAQVKAQAIQLTEQAKLITELQERLGKNGREPPSSCGFEQRTVGSRETCGWASGGQIGRPCHTLAQLSGVDRMEPHRPKTRQGRGHPLAEQQRIVTERRKVFDAPTSVFTGQTTAPALRREVSWCLP